MAGVNENIPEPHPDDIMRASWGAQVASGINRLSQFQRGSLDAMLANAAGVYAGMSPTNQFSLANSEVNTIPAYGVVLNSTPVQSGPNLQISVKRPDIYGSQWNAFINDGSVIPGNGSGAAQSTQFPMIALYNPSDPNGAPTQGQFWGPRSGDYYLHSATGGFLVVNTYDSTNNLCLVVPAPMTDIYGKNTGSRITKGNAGTINVYSGDPLSGVTPLADTGQTISNVVALFGDIPANAFVWARFWNNPTLPVVRWMAIQTDTCP